MPQRIAIIKPSALGDIVHALPVLSALRELDPTSHISWIVNRGFQDLLVGHPYLNDIIPFDRSAFRRGIVASARYTAGLMNRLRRERFDLVIDLQGLLRTGLMTAATGAPRRIGFDNAREGSRYFYTDRIAVPDAEAIHAVDRYWRIVEFLGGSHLRKQFHVPVNPSETLVIQQELHDAPRPWIAVAAGAKWLTKRWPPEHFAAMLNLAQQQFGGSAILVGSSDDIPLSLGVAQATRGTVRDFTGKTSLPKLAALFAQCDVMLGNDTGPLHLAAALGIPCVAPYTCTKIVKHGPYNGPFARETAVPCAGSYLKKCPHGMICMNELSPEKLWPAMHEVLQTWQRKPNFH